MPHSSPGSLGLIGNAAVGYRLAWAHRRQLLAVLLPVLAPAMLGLVLLDLLLGRDHMMIVNGVPVFHGDGTLGGARLILIVAAWLLALSAAALTAAGGVRGHAVRPLAALRTALRHFPVFAIGVVAVGVATYAALWMTAQVADGTTGLVLIVGVLVAAATVAARMLVGLLSHQLGGFDWRLTRGRVPSTAGAFLLGGVAVPWFLAYLSDAILTAVTAAQPAAGQAVGAILVIGLVAAQAGILAHVYLMPRDEPSLTESSSGRESADLAAVDARLAELAGAAPRRRWLAAAATAAAIAVLAPTGIAVANPFGASTVRSHEDAPGGSTVAAWPPGRHPVIATVTGARFCDNDVCDRYASPNGGPAVLDGQGTAGISADGDTVVKAVLTGGQDSGGPFIHYARCRRDGCREAWLPARASAREPFGWPDLAAAVAPDQAVWFVLAMPSDDEKPGAANYRLTFIRCADAGCAKPQRHQAGIVERLPDDEAPDRGHTRLSIDAAGRPVATIRTGTSAITVTCDPVTCAAPRTTSTFTGQPGGVWAAPTAFTEPAVSFDEGTLRIGEQTQWLDGGGGILPRTEAVAVSGSHVYVTAAEPTTRPGLHVTVGESIEQPELAQGEAGYWQQVLWRCDRSRCDRRILDASDSLADHETMAAAADGRVLIIRQDRILLVSAPAPR